MVEEHLPRDCHPHGPHRGFQNRRVGPWLKVPGRQQVGGERFDQAPQRDELTERDRPYLVVPVGHRAVGFDGRLVVAVGRQIVSRPVEPTGHKYGVQAGCFDSQGLGSLVSVESILATPPRCRQRDRVDHVFRPQDQVDRGLHQLVGLQLVSEYAGSPGGGGPRSLRSASLYQSHVQRAHRLAGGGHGSQYGGHSQSGGDHDAGRRRSSVGPTSVAQRREAHTDGHGKCY